MSTISSDYYETLNLKRDCTQEEIANAYRKLSLKYHMKNSNVKNGAVNEYHFHKVAEAYEVLSDPNKKGIYDIYGATGLRSGIVDREGNLKGGYIYGGNAHDIFEKFMGSSNPFAYIKDCDRMDDEWGSMFSSAYGGQYAKESEPLPNVEVNLECTLEELYIGCVKRLVYRRNVLQQDGRTVASEQSELDIEIFKGYDKSTVLTYPGQGNEGPSLKTSDLIVKIVERPHKHFKRVNKDDLVYVQKLTLVQALNSVPVTLTTLDGRKLSIAMDEIISPQTVKIVKSEGMPIFDKNDIVSNILYKEKRGSLYIKFQIEFPKFIDPEKKEEITRLLEN